MIPKYYIIKHNSTRNIHVFNKIRIIIISKIFEGPLKKNSCINKSFYLKITAKNAIGIDLHLVEDLFLAFCSTVF